MSNRPTKNPAPFGGSGEGESGATPPAYVNVPVSIVYAAVDAAVLVTMIRVLGLCWRHGYRRTPALTPDQLARLTGRSRSTFYRHLRILEQELGWLRVERTGQRLALHPLLDTVAPDPPAGPPAATRHCARLRTLAAAGIEDPARGQLARDETLDPAWVRAWHLWTRHPHRRDLANPPGLVVRRLQDRRPPPDEYLHLATLTEEEKAQIRASYWTGGATLDDELYRLRSLYFAVNGDPRDGDRRR